jgi:hypothetical protein
MKKTNEAMLTWNRLLSLAKSEIDSDTVKRDKPKNELLISIYARTRCYLVATRKIVLMMGLYNSFTALVPP